MKNVIFLCLILFSLVSCEQYFAYKSKPVNFTLPSTGTTDSIVYIDENHKIQQIGITKEGQKHISISLKKNHITPILLFSSPFDESPQGCIYPISTTLDVYGGFSSFMLYRLIRASYGDANKIHEYLSHFNWGRFTTYIKKYEDPWKLNQDLILENIADKTFNVYSIKEL